LQLYVHLDVFRTKPTEQKVGTGIALIDLQSGRQIIAAGFLTDQGVLE
jgi:hypothetical protein